MSVLLVEDSKADAKLMEHAFRKASIHNPLIHVSDGQQAWDYLNCEGNYSADEADHEMPAVILLDLNMPGMDGRMLLAKLKETPVLRRIPIIVMTTSDSPIDVATCYESGANAYIRKPSSTKDLYEIVKTLEQHWIKTTILPDIPLG